MAYFIKLITIYGVFVGLLGMVTVPVQAAAPVTEFTIFPVDTGLGTADLKDTVVNIIQWLLGVLALVAVTLIIYGGFVWLTAAGNEEKIEKAKKVISAAVIGLIIVLLAWAIVIFVAGTTKNVTT